MSYAMVALGVLMIRTRLLWMSILGLLIVKVAVAQDWQLVVRQDAAVDHLDDVQVQHLFSQGYLVHEDDIQLIDVEDEKLRAEFYQDVLSMSMNRWRAHWARLVFMARKAPPLQLSTDYIPRYLAERPNMIAYLPCSVSVPDNLKVIYCYHDRIKAYPDTPCLDKP